MTGGATVLNVYLIGQTVPCLFGVIPYLTLRREAPPRVEEISPANQSVHSTVRTS